MVRSSKKEAVVAGTIPEYKGDEPKKEGFAFAGWNPEIVAAVKDTTYMAVYKDPAEETSFTVSFDADTGTGITLLIVKSGDTVEKLSPFFSHLLNQQMTSFKAVGL
jgi:hypothetical protein